MRKMTYMLTAAMIAAAVLTGCAGRGNTTQEAKTTAAEETVAADSSGGSQTADAEKRHVKINVKDYGSITVELDPQYAPIAVENFLKLAGDGFYDGLTFHRIIKGFMIQGGDPQGTGMGGADETIKGEFSNNGVENPLSHTRGVISMARSKDADSASSQFFIVHEDSPHLDGDYAAFGQVTEGMDVVDKLCEDTPVTDRNGSVSKESQPVIESVEVLD